MPTDPQPIDALLDELERLERACKMHHSGSCSDNCAYNFTLRNVAPRLLAIARASKELVQNWDDGGECEADYVNALRAALEGRE